MSPRSTLIHFATNAAIGLGALFVVGVLLAAIPNHRAPTVQAVSGEATPQAMEHSSMSEMSMDEAQSNEQAAVHDMAKMHHGDSAHIHITAPRAASPADQQRAYEIVAQLRTGIEKYKDYHAALNDGYRIFLPNLPQREYHFTNYWNGFLEAFTFDPAKPTSLLYRKTASGYELVGAMYTMPKHATEEQLNERVPLSLATWHLHTNLCMPPKEQRRTADYSKFGLKGSIATEETCEAAGGRFFPIIFGWMVHVYPYEDSKEKIFAMHHHD